MPACAPLWATSALTDHVPTFLSAKSALLTSTATTSPDSTPVTLPTADAVVLPLYILLDATRVAVNGFCVMSAAASVAFCPAPSFEAVSLSTGCSAEAAPGFHFADAFP